MLPHAIFIINIAHLELCFVDLCIKYKMVQVRRDAETLKRTCYSDLHLLILLSELQFVAFVTLSRAENA